MILNIELVKLSAQIPTKIRTCEIVLEGNYFKYFMDFDSENLVNHDDPMLGWSPPERNYYEVYVKKASVTAIEKIWNEPQEKWQIDIIILAGTDIKLFFNYDKEEEADKILKTLLEWWFN